MSMAAKHIYTKAAGISLLLHIALLCLAELVTGQVVSISPVQNPSPIEIEIEPSRLLDMGSGKLHFTSRSAPSGHRMAAHPRIRIAAAGPAPPKPETLPPTPLSAPTSMDQLSPLLPGETHETSVALPLPGDKETVGSDSGYGAKRVSSGGSGIGTESSAGEGEGDGGGYAGAGYLGGALPGYPGAARRAGREGVVTVRVLVGTDGNPASVTVRVTSGYEDFDNAATQAVKKWRFSPALRGKVPVASFHDVRVRFRLDEAR